MAEGNDPLDDFSRQFDAELDEALASLSRDIDKTVKEPPSALRRGVHPPVNARASEASAVMPGGMLGRVTTEPGQGEINRVGTSGQWKLAAPSALKDDALQIEYFETVNSLLDHVHVPMIRRLSFRNARYKSFENLIVRIGGSNSPYLGEWTETVGRLRANDTWERRDIRVPLINRGLREVVEQVNDNLKVEFSEGGHVVHSRTYEVKVQPYNHWPLIPNLFWSISAFVSPNQQAIRDVIGKAARWQQEHYNHSSFEGYQCLDHPTRPSRGAIIRLLQQIHSLHDVLTDQGCAIEYINPPATFNQTGQNGQKVRFPYQVIAERRGTCLDLSVLLASMMEGIGLRPLVVILPYPGHAFVGCWLNHTGTLDARIRDAAADRTLRPWLANMSVNVRDDEKWLQQLSESGLLLFDSVQLTARQANDCRYAQVSAANHVANVLAHNAPFYLVDVAHCRLEEVFPLPHS